MVLSNSCFPVKLEAGRAKNLWNALQLEIASCFPFINIALLFRLFRTFSVADWGFPYENSCFKWALWWSFLRTSVFVSDSDFPPWDIRIFCCDGVELYPPPAPQVYRNVCELTPLSVRPCALREGELPVLPQCSWAVGTKAFVETLATDSDRWSAEWDDVPCACS